VSQCGKQERAAHEEFMSYVYMTLGFAVVIGIAWFSTVMAKKSKVANDLAKANRTPIKHAHDPYKRGQSARPRR
jgi:hypothetical protein